MAYDETTAARVRAYLEALSERPRVEEKPMVAGGLGFMVRGNLCVGVRNDGLTVRVGPDARESALCEPHVVPHLVGGRATKAFVVVEPDGYDDDADLARWIDRGLAFVETLGK